MSGSNTLPQWGHVRTIGRNEIRRRLRSLRDNTAQLLAIAFVVLFFGPMLLFGVFGVYLAGTLVRTGEVETPIEWARMAFVYGWLFTVAFGGYRAYATALRPDNIDGLLTTVSHRAVFGGLLYSEGVFWGIPTVVFGGIGAVAFAAGAHAPVVAPFLFLAVCATIATGLLAGFTVALVVRNTGVRSVLLTRLRIAFFVLLGVAYFWVIVTGAFASVLEPLYRLLAPTPIAWYGDLAMVGAGIDASLFRAAGAFAATVVGVAASGPVLARLAEWLWYADGVHVSHRAETESIAETDSALARVVPRPMLGVLRVDWKRARRAPVTLSFVLYPLILLVNPIVTTVETGTISGSFPLWILLCGAWITGSVFTLNVLGNEGAALPVTILGADPGRALVGGHVLAGALLGVPATVVATLGLGLASPHTPVMVATLVGSAFLLAASAGPIATGIGTLFPRYEAVSVSRSTKAIVPSILAFGVYSTVLVLVAVPTLLGHSAIVGNALAGWLDVSRLLIAGVGTGLTGIAAVGMGVGSTLFARRQVDGHCLG